MPLKYFFKIRWMDSLAYILIQPFGWKFQLRSQTNEIDLLIVEKTKNIIRISVTVSDSFNEMDGTS